MSGCGCGPQVANLEFRVGENWIIKATMHDGDGAILNLAGAEVFWRLALNGTVITTLSIGDGIEIIGDGSTGRCDINLTKQDQVDLGIVATVYQHECQVVLPDSEVSDQFAGNLSAKPSLFPLT